METKLATKALHDLLVFHDPAHPDHETLFEDYYESCSANEIQPTTEGLLADLMSAAKSALGEHVA